MDGRRSCRTPTVWVIYIDGLKRVQVLLFREPEERYKGAVKYVDDLSERQSSQRRKLMFSEVRTTGTHNFLRPRRLF